MNAKLVPPELLDPVVAYVNPRQVIVSGSVARGETGRDSDFDLLVIVDDDTLADKVKLKACFKSRRAYRHAADVIPVREATSQRKSKIANTLSRTAAMEGVVIYERR
jgi:predicted nucleotidyltransferase